MLMQSVLNQNEGDAKSLAPCLCESPKLLSWTHAHTHCSCVTVRLHVLFPLYALSQSHACCSVYLSFPAVATCATER